MFAITGQTISPQPSAERIAPEVDDRNTESLQVELEEAFALEENVQLEEFQEVGETSQPDETQEEEEENFEIETKTNMSEVIMEPVGSGPGNVVVCDGSNADSAGIITRVTSIPVVSSTLGQVSNMYTWTKESSQFANTALGYAEKSVSMAASTAQPVVSALDKPITMVNDFACHTLDKLEEKVPMINTPTEELLTNIQDGTKAVYDNTKQKGVDGVNRFMGTPVGKAVTMGIDTALAVSEYAVEYCLPADETEETGEKKIDFEDEMEDDEVVEKEAPTAVKRVEILTNKLRHRIHKKALLNIRYAQKRSQETIEKLHFTVDLIDYAKASIDSANQSIVSTAGDAKEKLWTTWNDWTTTEGEEDKGAEDEEVKDTEGDQKTLAIARSLAKRLRGITENVASSVVLLPQQFREKVQETRNLADSLHRSFEEAQTLSDVSAGLMTTCRDQLNNLSQASIQLADYVINSSPLQWLIPSELPNIEMEGLEFDYMIGSDQNDVDLTSDSSEF
ncbi:perilipin-2-like isoform X1 [Asterias amurensis]|uniref:perilipin-2-like isoform X1 n=1 Tax=Asterias amurensis TaxID=7602 RepID=UPI003AB35181